MLELLLSGASLITVLIIAFKSFRQFKEAKAMIPSLDDYIWEEDGEWRCDERLGKMVDWFGSRMAHSLRQSMFQAQGVDAKLAKNVDKAFSLDLLDNSGIGGVLDLLGMSNTKQILAKNPKTLSLILQRAAPLLKNINFGQGKNDGSSVPTM